MQSDPSKIHKLLKGNAAIDNRCDSVLKEISKKIFKLNPERDNQTIKAAYSM